MKCLFLLFTFFTTFALPEPMIEINLQVHSIQHDQGLVRVAVYDNEENFNGEPVYAFEFDKAQMKAGKLSCSFPLPPGNYAFSLLDDLDKDNEMAFNLIGVPQEGFGFSNDAKIRFLAPPSYESCKIQVGKDNHTFQVRMRYF